MNRRVEAPDSLDFFPTPPWATRAFLVALIDSFGLNGALERQGVWEPACGAGHMAYPLAEAFGAVVASDVFPHDWLAPEHPLISREVRDFLGEDPSYRPDWIITNPPFKTAVEFAERGLERARSGVALLVRTSWLEGGDRYERLFKPRRPSAVFQYVERVPMTRGRWEPDASTATSYCWVVWVNGQTGPTQFRWISPGSKKRFSRPEDLVFALRTDAPLFSTGRSDERSTTAEGRRANPDSAEVSA